MKKKNNKDILAVFFLLALSFFVFTPCLKNGFVQYDDASYLTENLLVQDCSWQGIERIFTTPVYGEYIPLSIFSFALECHFFKLSPAVYHLDNVILHLLNIVLVFWLIRLLSGRLFIALAVALLFAIHPYRVESVAWIAKRTDVLYSCFYLASLISYLRKKIIFSLLFFVLALMAKPLALSLPLVLLIIDYLIEGEPLKNIRNKFPFFIVAIVCFGWEQGFYMTSLKVSGGAHLFSIGDKLCLTGYALLAYIAGNFLPLKLAVVHPTPFKTNGHFPFVIYGSLVVIGGIMFALIKAARNNRAIVFGALFFCVTILLPLSNIWLDGTIINERYMYLPSIGLFYAFIMGFDKALEQRPPTKLLLLVLYIGLLGLLTFQYCRLWQNDITVWTNVIGQYRGTNSEPIAYFYRGSNYLSQHQIQEALNDENKAIAISPYFKDPYLTRGLIFLQQGQYREAVQDFDHVLKIDPGNFNALNDKAAVYFSSGDFNSAVGDLSNAIRLYPGVAVLYVNRGLGYMSLKEYSKAADDFKAAMRLEPQNPFVRAKYQEAMKLIS